MRRAKGSCSGDGWRPFLSLQRQESFGTPCRNLLIQGDNLDALKSLLPHYAGSIKCVFIDPPYNTGKAFGQYDDNLQHSHAFAITVKPYSTTRPSTL